jgi:hypothetical protein
MKISKINCEVGYKKHVGTKKFKIRKLRIRNTADILPKIHYQNFIIGTWRQQNLKIRAYESNIGAKKCMITIDQKWMCLLSLQVQVALQLL